MVSHKRVPQCCVPSCNSVDIKAEKHEFTWDMIRESIGIASIDSPGDISLCTNYYQQVYKMLDVRTHACKSCGAFIRNRKYNFFTCPDPELNLFSGIPMHLLIVFNMVIKCYPCHKYFNQMLKSDVCMLASEDVILALKAKNF